jgi:hypothetical protein
MESDLREVEEIRNNIKWLQEKMPNAIKNWLSTKPNCNYQTGLIKEICSNPYVLNRDVFDPLIKWLYDYQLNREGKLAFTGSNGVDYFLKLGLNYIYKFVVVVDFFTRNPDFFAPNPPGPVTSANLKENSEARKIQNDYQQILNILSSKLIGCDEKLSFLFLKLSRTVKNLPDNLKKIQTYLDQKCLSLKATSLKF